MNRDRVRLATVVVGAVAVLAGCASSDPSGAVAAGAASGDAHTVVMDGASFVPAVLEVPADQTVVIEVTNGDGDSHDFAIRSQELNTGTLESGAVATAEVVVGDEVIEYVCTFHDGMGGTIVPVTSGSGSGQQQADPAVRGVDRQPVPARPTQAPVASA